MTLSLASLLESWITPDKNYDFGRAYGHLRPRWYTTDLRTIKTDFRILEEKDQKMREDAIRNSRTIQAQTPPCRVWDLYSNRIVPQWIIPDNTVPWAISHVWMDDRRGVATPINRYRWPVPIPTDSSLECIRIEMLNLGAEYVWVDVLCLRQEGREGDSEAQREKEWRLDVPTIGYVYRWAKMVVYYFSGLGRALSDTAGDLESNRCWFKRAWTMQEISQYRIYAGGATDDFLVYAQAADEEDKVGSFQEQIGSLKSLALERNSL
ncbi:uncharacterized protein EV420DRAFT_1708640 [Desarmillaria tabescens]|uniref:Heterokaryon incompatibility domain-containing protein n=1 Tax=Armillaria tabescens TaxID=1929756 RepID=A0AA39JYT4_ARMTA|nr:uncharacterized protein EV420DRAFT_1708640 [Desarmillaria tabescens]KAK0449083.1 hypothetical protein EV420DRAFT_1708640 [Desarmillaria tabescens]